ncbi:YjgN family protein [Massilia sp. DD77]|uniref:YjgN family protein n=1 Tax=Massilia sp. DD77 TaxID=3109349 RepID=UPI002FFF5A85
MILAPDAVSAPAPDLPASPAAARAEPWASAPAPRVHVPVFTGSGQEYFRIWVVNLLLSLVTLGIYSAWAKVRRLQYFDRNTRLAGACFDFRGDPRAVLRGRLLALVLLAGYHYAFGFSVAFGVVVIGAILMALPYLMRGALRFRLANTQYRGLWLGFSGSVSEAYRCYTAPVAAFLLPGLLLAVFPEQPAWGGLASLLYLGWPLMHGQMKAYQHRHLLFGNRAAAYELSPWRFYRAYLVAGGIGLAFGIAASLLAGVAIAATGAESGALATFVPMAILALTGYVTYLLAGPFMQARLANLAWSHTLFSGVRIESTIPVRGFVMLQSKNAVLTVLTLGLYRPYAVVAAYRYRLEHTRVEVDGDVEASARATQGRKNAAGDGAADGLGIDLSW